MNWVNLYKISSTHAVQTSKVCCVEIYKKSTWDGYIPLEKHIWKRWIGPVQVTLIFYRLSSPATKTKDDVQLWLYMYCVLAEPTIRPSLSCTQFGPFSMLCRILVTEPLARACLLARGSRYNFLSLFYWDNSSSPIWDLLNYESMQMSGGGWSRQWLH